MRGIKVTWRAFQIHDPIGLIMGIKAVRWENFAGKERHYVPLHDQLSLSFWMDDRGLNAPSGCGSPNRYGPFGAKTGLCPPKCEKLRSKSKGNFSKGKPNKPISPVPTPPIFRPIKTFWERKKKEEEWKVFPRKSFRKASQTSKRWK